MEYECPFCGKEVDIDSPSTWKQVEGWVGGPRKDSMRLRRDTGEFAHDECVQRAQRGVAQDQTSLLEAPSASTETIKPDDELGLFDDDR